MRWSAVTFLILAVTTSCGERVLPSARCVSTTCDGGFTSGTNFSTLAATSLGAAAFTDVTESLGLPTATGTCLIFRDFDRDGRPDLMLSPPDNQGRAHLELWVNRGARFERHALPWEAYDLCEAADFDGDGWADVLVPGTGDDRSGLRLLRNTGTTGLEFEDASARLPARVQPLSWIAAPIDVDCDGSLDIVAGSASNRADGSIDRCDVTDDDFQCYLRATPGPPGPPALVRGEGGRSFALAPFGASPAYVNGLHAIDWNGDGCAELFVSVDFGRNQLVRAAAGGFRNVLATWASNPYNHGMGAAFADFDHDGRWDFYHADLGPAQLWYGAASGAVDRARETGVGDETRTRFAWSPVAEDFDNDGDVDIFVVNSAVAVDVEGLREFVSDLGGPVPPDVLAPLVDDVFIAQGGKFSHGTLAHRPTALMGGTAVAAAADFDGDGRVDIAEAVAGPAFEFRLLRNETPVGQNHWLGVRLVGRGGNADAVGATVYLLDGGRELDRRAVGVGGLATSDAAVHFGLGARTRAPALRVRWPGGALQDVPGPIDADRVLVLAQP